MIEPMHWQTTRFAIDLSAPKVMGIVNVTPDSFSDGGKNDSNVEVAAAAAVAMASAGASR